MWVIRAGTDKMLARIANREDPDQTASSAISVQNFRIFTIIINHHMSQHVRFWYLSCIWEQRSLR